MRCAVLCYIQQGIGKIIFPYIFSILNAKETWQILKQKISRNIIALKLQSFWRYFDKLRMEERDYIRFFSTDLKYYQPNKKLWRYDSK